MPKIKDLGFNVIPVTMRPLERYAGCPHSGGPGTPVEGEDCLYSAKQAPPKQKPKQKPKPKPKRHTIGHDAVAQLRQQLEERIRNGIES